MTLVMTSFKPEPQLAFAWLGLTPIEEQIALNPAAAAALAVVVGPIGPVGVQGPSGQPADLVQEIASAPSVSPNIDLYKGVNIYALAQNIAIGSPVGTPFDQSKLIIRVRDNGIATRTISWGSAYISGGPGFVTSTTLGKLATFGFLYDITIAKWILLAVSRQP